MKKNVEKLAYLAPDGRNGILLRNCGWRRRADKMVGNRLRSLYDGVIEETMPNRFASLLEKLEKAETKSCASRN